MVRRLESGYASAKQNGPAQLKPGEASLQRFLTTYIDKPARLSLHNQAGIKALRVSMPLGSDPMIATALFRREVIILRNYSFNCVHRPWNIEL